MPQNSKHIPVTSTTRKSAVKRKNKQVARCKEGAGKPAQDPAIIANSIFALTLPQRKAYELWVNDEVSPFEKSTGEIADDLLAAVNRAFVLKGKQKVTIAKAADTKQKLEFVLAQFKQHILPEGYEFNINKDESGRYYFLMYKPVEFGEYWHTFHIKPVMKWLEKKDPQLTEIFLDVIDLLVSHCDFNIWYGSWYPYDMFINDEWASDDYICNNLESCETDEERLEMSQKWAALKQCYKSGEAFHLQKRISKRKSNIKKVNEFLKQQRTTPFITWLRMAAEIINDGKCLQNFKCEELHEFDTDGMFHLEDQVMILYDEDWLFDEGCEYVDNDANNFGVEYPFNCIPVSATNRFIADSDLAKDEMWMLKISSLYQFFHQLSFIKQSAK